MSEEQNEVNEISEVDLGAATFDITDAPSTLLSRLGAKADEHQTEANKLRELITLLQAVPGLPRIFDLLREFDELN